jgi:hypothetical protein
MRAGKGLDKTLAVRPTVRSRLLGAAGLQAVLFRVVEGRNEQRGSGQEFPFFQLSAKLHARLLPPTALGTSTAARAHPVT